MSLTNFFKSIQIDLSFDEAERILLTRMLTYVIVSTMIVVLAVLPFIYALVLSSPLRIGLTISVFAVNAVGWFLLRRGLLIPTSAFLTVGYWVIVFILVMVTGGLESPWVLAQVAVTVIAGLLLGGWGGIFIAGSTVIADFVIYQISLHGSMPISPIEAGLLDNWLAIIASFAIISLVILMAGSLAQSGLRRAKQNERRYRSLFENTNDAVFLIDLNMRYFEVNKQAADLLGYEPQELIGKSIAEVVAPDELAEVKRRFNELRSGQTMPLFERTMVRKDGSRIVVEVNVSVVRNEIAEPIYHQSVMRDITERKRLEEQLRISLDEMEALAMQDPLTGLLNRRAITEHAEAEWHRAQRDNKPMCIVLLDLDNLKVVNDTEGHQMGDQVITALAKVIEGSKRRYDWAGRWGGDEFMLVLPGANLPEAKEVAERLRTKYTGIPLTERLRNEAQISLGIACYSGRMGDETTLDKLISQADQALYAAKEHGKNKVEVYMDEKPL